MTRVYCFEAYGLNKYRNFLSGKFLRGYDLDGVCDLCADILDEYDCGDSAIFIHSFDGEMYIVTWDYEEEMYKLLQSENPKQDFFFNNRRRMPILLLCVDSGGKTRIVEGC